MEEEKKVEQTIKDWEPADFGISDKDLEKIRKIKNAPKFGRNLGKAQSGMEKGDFSKWNEFLNELLGEEKADRIIDKMETYEEMYALLGKLLG